MNTMVIPYEGYIMMDGNSLPHNIFDEPLSLSLGSSIKLKTDRSARDTIAAVN